MQRKLAYYKMQHDWTSNCLTNLLHFPLPVSSEETLKDAVFVVYARGSKRSHMGDKCVTGRGLHIPGREGGTRFLFDRATFQCEHPGTFFANHMAVSY